MSEQEGSMYTVPIIDMVETGRRIKVLRKASGMTVRQMQDVFGFSTPQAIYKWQRGECMPTLDNLIVLSALFGVPMDEIVVIVPGAVNLRGA